MEQHSKMSLIELRSQSGFTQRELAQRAGLSMKTIGEAEKLRPIRLTTAYAVLSVLNKRLKTDYRPEDLAWRIANYE